jgi:Flp pilus assembly protein TadG
MRNIRGSSLAETAASLALLFPLLVVMLFVMLETSYAMFLKAMLAEASRTASRNLAIAYGQNPLVANNWSLEDSNVLQKVRIANVVNASAQFDPPIWNTTVPPYTVTVDVHYKSGQYGLPLFPYPDVLKLGTQFVPSAQSTYKLE